MGTLINKIIYKLNNGHILKKEGTRDSTWTWQ